MSFRELLEGLKFKGKYVRKSNLKDVVIVTDFGGGTVTISGASRSFKTSFSLLMAKTSDPVPP